MYSREMLEREMVAIAALRLVGPTNKKRTVGRKANAHYRTREHLTEREVERLVEAAKDNRHDYCFCFWHCEIDFA